MQLQEEVTCAGQTKRINSELRGEHQAACDLVQYKNRLLELGQAEIQLGESLSQAVAQQEEQGARWESNLALLKTTTTGTFKQKIYRIPSLITKD